MSDFFQNGIITTLHRLRERPVKELEVELESFAAERPMALVLPCLWHKRASQSGRALRHHRRRLHSAPTSPHPSHAECVFPI